MVIAFDEVVRPLTGSRVYFKPPGIGKDRSGIVENPDGLVFSRKSRKQRKEIAARLFGASILGEVLSGRRYPGARTGFIYGVKNEIISPAHHSGLLGQTKKYVEEAQSAGPKDRPTFVFSPDTVLDLEKAVAGAATILSLQDLETKKLENRVYVVAVGAVPNDKFTGLLASADLPVFVEGNSSLSTAIKLQIPFLMIRSPWNSPQIQNVSDLGLARLHSDYFKNIYDLSKEVVPLIGGKVAVSPPDTFFGALSLNVPYLAQKFDAIIDIIEQLKALEAERESLVSEENLKAIESKYSRLSEMVYDRTRDEVLSYSLLFDAHKRGLISERILIRRRNELQKLGYSLATIETKFIPNVPGFSEKILELERVVHATPPVQEAASPQSR